VHSDENNFFNALQNGKWNVAKEIYGKNPGVLKVICLNYGKSALHIAVIAGHTDIVEWLIGLMEPKDLEQRGSIDGFTALADATMSGITSIAKSMVRKNPRIVSIATETGMIPVVLALAYGNKKMARYLYEVTPLEEL
ncbi:Transmembrane protein, partial [Parasponia andersonii]